MANRPIDPEEKRSYAATFALCAGALLAVALWSVLDDLFQRRPWKKYQAELSWRQIETLESEIAAGEEKLAKDEAYQKLMAELEVARESLERGPGSKKRQELIGAIERAQVRAMELDQELRFVKSAGEEARYEYDHAQLPSLAFVGWRSSR